ncbi:hypothetical protein A3J56_00170 [Candidatus Giovannonibacteria bacterium RIFCSPHIGHO2_02_FULL_46_20]|uniref:Glycosyltransferase RgtA/B/C/D-like domain-containing protein n=1 Tax=Candidatus Giovannonibacteria bacterium RIFCSPHIGHO2_02_FULL_46_20 TaxID=1798338 RepID=A0A1F5WDF3_9BACT|nr:MAG: hypothetical protein A3J56_00170 [Candidatus Giovannonibacteria bacterium RIFCSPHIGHO2_02_FULL_46_20]
MQENIRKYLLNTHILLLAVLLLGFSVRIWGLGSAEIFHDEGLYAFRSIGYLDYVQNIDQTTPIEWFADRELPWWTNLSFHDAPPLFFLVQHIFFRIFGDSLFVARLPSLIAGMFAILLMYLIGKRITIPGVEEERNLFGLFAALLLSINHIHIWISRSSLLESLLLTLILANIYFFLRFVHRGSPTPTVGSDSQLNWLWFGITFGLALLTKYTGIFLLLLYGVYCVLFYRPLLKHWRLYAACGIAILVFSPVLIYNAYLYTASGHFDLQFAYLFGQETPGWRAGFLGKSQEPFSNILQNLTAMYSVPFLVVTMLSALFALVFQKARHYIHITAFALLGILSVTFLLTSAGSAYRFLVLYAPFAILLIILTGFLLNVYTKANRHVLGLRIIFVAAFIFLASEIWFTIDGIFLEFPQLGIVEMNRRLDELVGEGPSQTLPQVSNFHLNAVVQRYARHYPPGDHQKIIVYDSSLIISAKLWLFTRRFYYHGIPTFPTEAFKQLIQERGVEYFKNYEIYFVRVNEQTVLANPYAPRTPHAKELEDFLTAELGLSPSFVTYAYQPTPEGGYQQLPALSLFKITF